MLAIFDAKRQLHTFFNLDNLVKQLFQTEGPKNSANELIFTGGNHVDPTLQHLDRVTLSIAVKDSLYSKLLTHNAGIAEERKRYGERIIKAKHEVRCPTGDA